MTEKGAVKKEYFLEGLQCAHCAGNIETEVRKLHGVSEATVNFVIKTLHIESDAGAAGDLSGKVDAIAKKYEPDIIVREKGAAAPAEKSIYLAGLNCADCAARINLAVKRLEGVHSAHLDVVSQKLTIQSFDRGRLTELARQAGEIALRIEPDIKIAYSRAQPEPENKNSITGLADKAAAILGIVGFVSAFAFSFPASWELGLYLLSYLLIGGKVLLRALRNIARGQVFDENSL
ncbi:MAG: cation transporter, partial [Syntrophomonadaceae bacterium]|nr:cation transporter [Syntrophomonadaceae bacterium]